MKKSKIIIIFCLLSAFSCANTQTDNADWVLIKDSTVTDISSDISSSKASIKDETPFSEIQEILTKAQKTETNYCSHIEYNENILAEHDYYLDESIDIYQNNTLFSTGTVKKEDDNKDFISDTFIHCATVEHLSIDNTDEKQVIFEITDFTDDVFSDNFTDDLKYESESQDSTLKTTSNKVSEFLSFCEENIFNNNNAFLNHKTTFSVLKDTDISTYSYSLAYFTDSTKNITNIIRADFSINLNDYQISSLNYRFISNQNDTNSTSGFIKSAVFNYNERSAEAKKLNYQDYFLSNVNSFGIYNSDNTLLNSTININENKNIQAIATQYEPKKAINLALKPVSVSNEKIAKIIDDKYIELLMPGYVTITFSYTYLSNNTLLTKEVSKNIQTI